MVDDDFEKFRREWLAERISKAVKEAPKNWGDQLEELGFQWFDDEEDHEETEEASAKPENARQELLVAYFEGESDPSDQELKAYLDERESPEPNFALIRRYYKQANRNLHALLIRGLEERPTDQGLLDDLAYFHEFRGILGELIRCYKRACEEEQDLERFAELAMRFYHDTAPDGFDAFHDLEQAFDPDSQKADVIRQLRQAEASQPESIDF